ncbi:unnamed protein product [marine sediment metagenome]|uniref:Uncharacterized protein n=1 Tax=marine sediment metagenome TaxID=412755 RepID=X1FK89_9ZZZZ
MAIAWDMVLKMGIIFALVIPTLYFLIWGANKIRHKKLPPSETLGEMFDKAFALIKKAIKWVFKIE